MTKGFSLLLDELSSTIAVGEVRRSTVVHLRGVVVRRRRFSSNIVFIELAPVVAETTFDEQAPPPTVQVVVKAALCTSGAEAVRYANSDAMVDITKVSGISVRNPPSCLMSRVPAS